MRAILVLLAGCAGAEHTVTVEVGEPVAEIDERFLSVAVDVAQVAGTVFWNPDAQDDPEITVEPYDFGRPALRSLAAELAPAWLRIGGTDADILYYDLDGTGAPEGYGGALTAEAWGEVGAFARDLDYSLMFTVNAGPSARDAEGAWVPDNAAALMAWSAENDVPVEVWELGNEPNSFVIEYGVTMRPEVYAADAATLAATRDAVVPEARIAGPTTAFWPVAGEFVGFVEPFMAAGAPVDVLSWHYYPQQSDRCPAASRPAGPEVMLDPENLDEVARWAELVEASRDAWRPEAEVWLGETGNAQCGGQPGVSDRFASSFWWLDQLGTLARRGQQAVVRQTLSGSDYGIVDDATLEPRPDYWASLLWRRTMGTTVLEATSDDPLLRVYAHCARDGGVAVLAIHLGEGEVEVDVGLDGPIDVYAVTSTGLDGSEVRLNGEALRAPDGVVPELVPERKRRAVLADRGYAFLVFPEADVASCR